MAAPTPDTRPARPARRQDASWSPPRRGTGIGFATAKRCVQEGAQLVMSDIHERRLGEAAERLAEDTGDAPAAASAT